MNIKEFKKTLTGKTVRFAPVPERWATEGESRREFEYNEWFVEPIPDDKTRKVEFSNMHTGHRFELGFDSINQFREPNFLMLRCKVIVRENKIETEPLLPSVSIVASTPSIRAGATKAAVPALSEQAKSLLIEAASDQHGIVMKIGTLGGLYVQTNGKQFVEKGNPRSQAAWEEALEQLRDCRLLREKGVKGEVFSVTAEGYRVADLLRA